MAAAGRTWPAWVLVIPLPLRFWCHVEHGVFCSGAVGEFRRATATS